MHGTGTQAKGNFKILSRQRRRYPHFGMEETFIEIDPKGANVEVHEYVNELFSFTLRIIIHDVPPEAHVGVTIMSTTSILDRPMYVGWRKWDELNPNVILSAMENVLSSNETFRPRGDKTTLG